MMPFALLVFLALSLGTNQASAQLQKIRAANGGFGTAINAILPGAYHAKIFQKYGLEAEYEVQVLFTTGALAVTANLQGGDSTIIAGGINFFPFKLIVRPEIRNATDLHGKKLAISRFGSASDYAAQLGGVPKQVTMLQLGGNPSRLAAMISGTAHATVFSEPFASVAVKQGMRSLLDLADSGVPFPQNTFIVRRSVLAERRPMVVNAMKASIETLYLLKKDRKFAREVLKRYLRIDDDAMIDIGIDYYMTRHSEGVLTLPDRKGVGIRHRRYSQNQSESERSDAGVSTRARWQRARRNQEERVCRKGQRLSDPVGSRLLFASFREARTFDRSIREECQL